MKIMRRVSGAVYAAVTVLCALFLAGCARSPQTQTGTTRGKIAVFTLTYRGPVNIDRQPQGNYYFVLINRTDDPSDFGPGIALQPPFAGNGIGAAFQGDGQGFVGLVRYERNLSTIGGLQVEASTDAAGNLVNPTTLSYRGFNILGPPDRIISVPTQGGSPNVISFQLDLSRLPNPNAQFMQVNVISTNIVPQNTSENVQRDWDALGDNTTTGNINDPFTLNTTQNAVYTNAQRISTSREPAGDVRSGQFGGTVDDPSLDLVDWTIQIRDP
jgi:hypothetical protein